MSYSTHGFGLPEMFPEITPNSPAVVYNTGQIATLAWLCHLEAPAFRPGSLICSASVAFRPLLAGFPWGTLE